MATSADLEAMIAEDPARAAAVLADLSARAADAVGVAAVRRRISEAQSKRQEAEKIVKRVARLHAVALDAILGDSQKDHIIHAKRHAAYELRRQLGLPWVKVGTFMRCDHSTALRRAREWTAYLEAQREA